MNNNDSHVPPLIIGKSYIKNNKEIETDINIIKNNRYTILNQICSQKKIPEGIPPPVIMKNQQEIMKDLKKNLPKNNNSIITSILCVHQ